MGRPRVGQGRAGEDVTFDGGPAYRRAWRARGGRKVKDHLYLQPGAEPDDSDPSIGWTHDPAYVDIVVRAINDGEAVPGARWWCAGLPTGRALVYDRPGADIASGWVMAVRSKDIADRIVAAVNGDG